MSVNEYYETYWSTGGFNPKVDTPEPIARLFAQFLPPGSRCLDLGCGDGRMSGLWLRERQHDYTGVDVSQNAIDAARSLGLRALKVEDASRLPFAEDSFDAVVCVEVVEHLFQPEKALGEALRVLTKGGVLIVTTPNVAYWRRRADLAILGRWNPLGDDLAVQQPWRDPHIRFFNRGSLTRVLKTVGFDRVAVGGHGGSFLRDVPWIGHRLGSKGSAPYRFLERCLPPLFAYRLHGVAFKPV